MKEEFNLSDKIERINGEGIAPNIDIVLKGDVKEAVKKLKEKIASEDRYLGLGRGTGVLDIDALIDNIFGKELSE